MHRNDIGERTIFPKSIYNLSQTRSKKHCPAFIHYIIVVHNRFYDRKNLSFFVTSVDIADEL